LCFFSSLFQQCSAKQNFSNQHPNEVFNRNSNNNVWWGKQDYPFFQLSRINFYSFLLLFFHLLFCEMRFFFCYWEWTRCGIIKKYFWIDFQYFCRCLIWKWTECLLYIFCSSFCWLNIQIGLMKVGRLKLLVGCS